VTWRWLDDLILPALGTLLESLWLAVLVAGVSGRPPALALVFLVIRVGWVRGMAAALRRPSLAAGLGPPPPSYLALLPIGVVTAFVMLLVWPIPPAIVVPAVVVVALLASIPVWLGLRLGRHPLVPADVPGRAGRAFVTAFLVVLVAQSSGRAVPGAAITLAAVLLVAVVMVACARLAAGGAARETRRTQHLWLLAVFCAGALIVGAGALLGGAMPSGLVLVPLHVVSTAVGYLVDAVGWILGNLGALFVRGLSALLGSFDPDLATDINELPVSTTTQRPSNTHVPGPVVAIGEVFVILAAAALIVLLGRVSARRRTRRVVEIVEERESVWSTSEMLHAGADRVRRALRRVARLRAAKPRHAPDALRWEYRRLEHSLDDRGHARPVGTTARAFLEGLTGYDFTTASELSALYELARYSAHEVGWDEVERFHVAAARFVTAARAPSPPVALE